MLCGLALVTGCAEGQRAPAVTEYLENPIMLEATVVRCARNRSESRYEADCVNARQAVSIIAAKEERARRDEFEAESEKKRQALRRTQQIAAEARRRAAEAERMSKEAEYLAQFGELPPRPDGELEGDDTDANAPGIVIPEAANEPDDLAPMADPLSLPDGGNAPVAVIEQEIDLEAVRDELRKRNEESGN